MSQAAMRAASPPAAAAVGAATPIAVAAAAVPGKRSSGSSTVAEWLFKCAPVTSTVESRDAGARKCTY